MRTLFFVLSVVLFGSVETFASDYEIVGVQEVSLARFDTGGATLIAKGNSKGQTFIVDRLVTLEAITLMIKEVSASNDLQISFVSFRDGFATGKSLYVQTGELPKGLVSGQTIKLNFDSPVHLERGEYAFVLSTSKSEFKLRLGNVYADGRLIRKNKTTKGKWMPGGSGASTDLIFELKGLPLPSVKGSALSNGDSDTELMGPVKTRTLHRYENPAFKVGNLKRLARAPNIITVMVDDLGWNQIGVQRATYGTNTSDFQTPNLARMADEGLCFTNAYAQPNCAPTRAAMLSGQYPARIHNDVYVVSSLNRFGRGGVTREAAKFTGPRQSEDVAVEAVTLAEALKANGYQTAHIGKYHVGGHEGQETLPENVGFDINIGGFTQGHQPVCFATEKKVGEWVFRGLGRGHFDRFAMPYDNEYLERHDFPRSLVGTPKHVSDALGDAVEETVGSLAANSEPFYLQVHPYAVHGPVQSRPDLKAASGNDAFFGFVKSVDAIVGRVLKVVEDPNGDGDQSDSIVNDTVVFFTSDNGGTHKTNLPLRGTKGMFTEGGIRVPLIARWPGQIPPMTVTTRLVHTVDYYPTYLQLAGNTWRPSSDVHPLDGVSFAETLVNPAFSERGTPVFYLFPGYLDRRAQPCVAAIQQIDGTQYKALYFFEADEWQLYDITHDIGESKNIASQKPKLMSLLAKQLIDWISQEHPTWKPKLPIVKKTGRPASIPMP